MRPDRVLAIAVLAWVGGLANQPHLQHLTVLGLTVVGLCTTGAFGCNFGGLEAPVCERTVRRAGMYVTCNRMILTYPRLFELVGP
ncbi:hypothetical protein BDV98DRAFT_570931 [Pterulicium gracile]|uniref:Uncharacterized protein n=1 Tax=Pterulicium gracile TaxID=1884261 RepID=A0A5C3QCG1_9AGAR|nr:hypothetical protein BDV98DRAFT_570931 [Pterula gracilis]